MVWVIVGAVVCLSCYLMGFVIGELRAEEKFKEARREMGFDDETPDECYGCREVGLPCDPNCQYNLKGKELKVKDVESEKNDSEEN